MRPGQGDHICLVCRPKRVNLEREDTELTKVILTAFQMRQLKLVVEGISKHVNAGINAASSLPRSRQEDRTAIATMDAMVPDDEALAHVAESFNLDNPGDHRELLWKVRQLQDDCASLGMTLLKSRDLEDEDDDTILTRLPSKNLSTLAVERMLQSEAFMQRTQRRSSKRKEMNRDDDRGWRKKIKIEEDEE